jgi:hypothetical protein
LDGHARRLAGFDFEIKAIAQIPASTDRTENH